MLVAIDPGSTVAGWAVLDVDGRLFDCGTVKAPKGWAPWRRTRKITGELVRVVGSHWYTGALKLVVIESPSGNVRAPTARGGKVAHGSIAVLAAAYGAIRWASEGVAGCTQVVGVPANTWTTGKPKDTRTVMAARVHHDELARREPREYPSQDALDAVALGDWWLDTERARTQGEAIEWVEPGHVRRFVARELASR